MFDCSNTIEQTDLLSRRVGRMNEPASAKLPRLNFAVSDSVDRASIGYAFLGCVLFEWD